MSTEQTEAQLTPRQLKSYHDHRKRLIDWLLTRGKDPDRGHGYAEATAQIRAYRLDKFYRAVWDAEDRYTEYVTTSHADAWLLHLDDRDLSNSYKASCMKALQSLFEWKADTTNTDWNWEPVKHFSSDPAHQPRDFLTREERDQLREAALTYNALPNYYEADDDERDKHLRDLAMRFGKPQAEIGVEEWQQVSNWKVPSLIWTTLDAGLRPVEIGKARVSWVDTENGVLRIPKEDSAKNTENWHTPIRDRTVMALEQWLTNRNRLDKYNGTDALWLTRYGNPYDSNALNGLLRRVLEETEIATEDRDLTWYSIRHSVGTYMTREEDLTAAASQLRHKSTRTTVKYDQTPVEDRRDALDKMG
ncbi:tyrosine-type recombinase/integrase [Halorussus litoreus]|uniref:tyrosine-type recombinase/integrase n=1 Tax=Halorussus litoreus TaxID=1710536 RepID=UPI001E4A95E7|nr:site-specific integrase [Halorussus litoreus]